MQIESDRGRSLRSEKFPIPIINLIFKFVYMCRFQKTPNLPINHNFFPRVHIFIKWRHQQAFSLYKFKSIISFCCCRKWRERWWIFSMSKGGLNGCLRLVVKSFMSKNVVFFLNLCKSKKLQSIFCV